MSLKRFSVVSGLILSLALSQGADAWNRFSAAGGHQNPGGGYRAGSVRSFRGPQGSGRTRAWGAASDGQGNAIVGSGRTFQGPRGVQGARGGYTTRSADGTVQHQGGAAWRGLYGQGKTQSSLSRTPGSVTGSVNTDYQTNWGGSYQGSTTGSYNQGSLNINHSGTCYDPTGAVVPCPSR